MLLAWLTTLGGRWLILPAGSAAKDELASAKASPSSNPPELCILQVLSAVRGIVPGLIRPGKVSSKRFNCNEVVHSAGGLQSLV